MIVKFKSCNVESYVHLISHGRFYNRKKGNVRLGKLHDRIYFDKRLLKRSELHTMPALFILPANSSIGMLGIRLLLTYKRRWSNVLGLQDVSIQYSKKLEIFFLHLPLKMRSGSLGLNPWILITVLL